MSKSIKIKMSILKSISIVFFTLAISFSTNAQILKAEIVATGLTCSMCSNAINKQLKSLSDVESVDIDLNTNTFTVHLKRNNLATPKLLKTSVEKAGFFVGSMVVTMQFEEVKINDNMTLQTKNATLIFLDTEAKTLKGATKIKIQDKGFVTQKEYKKLMRSYAKYPSYAAGDENDYHVVTL